jgi:hypothetical protein
VNNGAGEFQLSQHFHAHFKPPFSSFNVNLVDVSGEGLVDIVFWNEKSGFSVSLNEGGGTFRGPYHFAVNMSASRATYGDFDHDGDTDIVAASPTRDALFYLENFFVD